MSGDIKQFLETQRRDILKEKRRLEITEENKENVQNLNCEDFSKQNFSSESSDSRGRETLSEKNVNENVKKRPIFVEASLGNAPESVLKCGNRSEEDKKERTNFEVENVPSLVEPLELSECYDEVLSLEERKQVLVDRLVNSEGPFSYRSADEAAGLGAPGCKTAPFGLPSLRRGEYAPTSHARLRAAPHEGLGEYDIRRRTGFLDQDRSTRFGRDYLRPKVKYDLQQPQDLYCPQLSPSSVSEHRATASVSPRRTVTDELVDAALRSGRRHQRIVDQRLTSAQNDLVLRATSTTNTAAMDKPKSILSNRRTGSPRERYTSDLGHGSYTASNFLDGFSYSDRTDELERERLKREAYQHELRLQIEEKHHLAALRDEQERHERDLANRRLEQQLLRMREDQLHEDRRRLKRNELMRRHSDDLLRRKTELHELQRPWRRHADSESANLDSLGLPLGTSPSSSYSATLGGYSPPVSRRATAVAPPIVSPYSSYNVPSATSVFAPDSSSVSRYNPTSRFDSASSYAGGGILRNKPDPMLRRMGSLNSYDTVPLPRSAHRSKFDRFDSLSRIDSLGHRLETMSMRDDYTSSDLTDVQRRHSATQQDLTMTSSRSPRMRRRNSSTSRFDDSLPVPVLKAARSPVAKELRNAVPFSSSAQHRSSSDAIRRLEDRWQIPAVQKTILHHPADSPLGSGRGSILTQLGSIRTQLQREQLRMDETLRRRGVLRTRTTDQDY